MPRPRGGGSGPPPSSRSTSSRRADHAGTSRVARYREDAALRRSICVEGHERCIARLHCRARASACPEGCTDSLGHMVIYVKTQITGCVASQAPHPFVSERRSISAAASAI